MLTLSIITQILNLILYLLSKMADIAGDHIKIFFLNEIRYRLFLFLIFLRDLKRLTFIKLYLTLLELCHY